jgi:hypothetical protein
LAGGRLGGQRRRARDSRHYGGFVDPASTRSSNSYADHGFGDTDRHRTIADLGGSVKPDNIGPVNNREAGDNEAVGFRPSEDIERPARPGSSGGTRYDAELSGTNDERGSAGHRDRGTGRALAQRHPRADRNVAAEGPGVTPQEAFAQVRHDI